MMRENKSYEKHPTHQALYDARMQSLILDEYEMEKAKAAETPTQKKRRHDDRDQEPPARPYQEMMKKKISKDAKPSKRPKSTGSSKGTTKSQLKSTGNTDEQPNVKAASKYDWFKKPPRPPTPNPEWNKGKSVDDEPNNPEGEVCPYDLNIPIPLHESRGHLTVLADSFFNNNLEYLKTGSTKRKYTTSKATKYKLEGIKDMVPKIPKNLLDRVSQLRYPFSLPERLTADNMVRVNMQDSGLFIVHSRNRLGRLDQGLTEF
ncbi:hypothetical protein Tco_0532326 [Tanacetum coccineum]